MTTYLNDLSHIFTANVVRLDFVFGTIKSLGTGQTNLARFGAHWNKVNLEVKRNWPRVFGTSNCGEIIDSCVPTRQLVRNLDQLYAISSAASRGKVKNEIYPHLGNTFINVTRIVLALNRWNAHHLLLSFGLSY